MNNPFITLENLRRFYEDLRTGIKEQVAYIDKQDGVILSSAKSYADMVGTNSINVAMNDSTNKSNNLTALLNTHSSNVTDAHNMDNRLQLLKTDMSTYVDKSIASLVNGAPTMLDTLQELSKAIGNDPNFAATYSDMIGKKLDASEVVNIPTANKVLRLDVNSQYAPSLIAQDQNNRFVTDAQISSWNAKQAAMVLATELVDGIMSAADKTKLDGIAVGATNYVHPANHPPSIISQDLNNRFVTDDQINMWNAKQSALSLASDTADGIMSKDDKVKLDSVYAGAEVNQNAFSFIQVGVTKLSSAIKQDLLTLVPGKNITITADPTTNKITISVNGDMGLNLLKRNISYAVGDIAYSGSLPSWARLDCVTAGTTATTEPTWGTIIEGKTIVDGTVSWMVSDVKHALYA